MKLEDIATITFHTHRCTIRQDEEDRVYVFKHTDNRCDLDSFDTVPEAVEWIIEGLPSLVWCISIED